MYKLTQKGKITINNLHKGGIQNKPNRSPVKEPNAKHTNTHPHNSASLTRDPKPNCKKNKCVKDATIAIISLTEQTNETDRQHGNRDTNRQLIHCNNNSNKSKVISSLICEGNGEAQKTMTETTSHRQRALKNSNQQI